MTEWEKREKLWSAIDQLEGQRCLPAIRQARQMLVPWLRQHPDDYASLDVKHELAAA